MVEGALTVCSLRGRRLRLFLLPLDLYFLGRHLQFAGHEMLGGCGERGREVGGAGFLWRGGGGVWLCLGILVVLGKMQIESTVFSTVVAGLNNQRGGESYCAEVQGSFFGNIPNMRCHLVDCLD
jgi:hypothetical protein